MTPKLSVVAAYHNRRESFINTLKSISKSKYSKDIEIVVTDDNSREDQRIDDLPLLFPNLFIKVLTVKGDHKWRNSCIAHNIAIRQATGNLILLQNPENYHVTDIISHAIDNLQHEEYYTYKVFALTQEQSKDLDKTIATVPFESITGCGCENGWYNHPQWRAGYYHFVSAIWADVLQKDLNGFDERYANGWGFEDDDLIIRINNRGLKKSIVNDHLALHQWHKPTPAAGTEGLPASNEWMRNITLREGKIRAN